MLLLVFLGYVYNPKMDNNRAIGVLQQPGYIKDPMESEARQA